MPFPHDPKLRGLAAALFHSDIPPWEYDIRAVPPGTEPLRVSDWHRRHGRANNESGSMERVAEARIRPVTKVPERD